ncbi:flagellar motor protein MotB [Flavobacterium magnum]|uniref:Flagellar motor protein MotB n=2 Tax=Flavobacterium magnum TaxID=2162713 RepID=A0A2S0RIK5_9FLAO|nr:OmpA family protein [Flavobacterium magnum]AWA31369.1 flagellar motor protein MotB [Flavobacterium magnum]
MKKLLLTLTFVSTLSLSAQTDTETAPESVDNGFNKWSLELNGGVNKPSSPFAPGYFSATPSFFNADFGARYMFNNKFGVKFDFGYYKLQDNESSLPFNTKYYRADIQGVANIGRIMNFETWTKRIGALIHLGGGYMQFRSNNLSYTDRGGNFIVGLTGQYKLAKRVVITGDFTSITNVSQDKTFDGTSGTGQIRGFAGGIFSGTIGLTVYLGSHEEHADWYVDSSVKDEEVDALKKRVGDLETMLNDTDKDGVPDYLDAEPNSMTGVAVDSKGRTVDANGNGVPDELESYMNKTYGAGNTANNTNINNTPNNNALVKALINDGYVTTYYDFNKSTPTNVSTEGIDFILTYLRNNPTATVDIIGHADEIGRTPYNDKLSQARANSVKNILIKAKIDPSRLNVVPAGEDASVDKESAGARKLVRRVTFKVK